jgi:hypothetical protein
MYVLIFCKFKYNLFIFINFFYLSIYGLDDRTREKDFKIFNLNYGSVSYGISKKFSGNN